MVSYYNTLPYSQKHSAANLAYSAGQAWQWPANYHTPPNHQFLGEMDSPQAHHHMYYNPHHMFHTPGSAAGDWHTPAAPTDNFVPSTQPASTHHMLQQHHANVTASIGASGVGVSSSSSSSSTSNSVAAAAAALNASNTQLNESVGSIGEPHIAEGLPSPPITVSAGSEISSPGAPASSSPHHITHHHNTINNNNNNNNNANANNNNSHHHAPNHHNNSNNNNNTSSNNNNNNNNNNRSSPVKAQYYDWMKKPAYPAQPTPGDSCSRTTSEFCSVASIDEFEDFLEAKSRDNGKTRTKDKYRVVYTDFQRLELEKEYCTSRYITIRRKTELAQTLSLSERQVKIWFQNRRAKERKQNKKGSDSSVIGGVQHADYANLMDTKPKLEPGLHLQHSLHSMAAMSMPSMSLHHHLHSHHPLAHSHQLHQSSHAQMSAAAALSM